MAAQRGSKILGIFVRLLERDGKPQYLRHIPRIKAYLARTLDHPSLAALRDLYLDWGVLDEAPTQRPL
jgi:aminoglycoside/choline kinase family phosphotransferase